MDEFEKIMVKIKAEKSFGELIKDLEKLIDKSPEDYGIAVSLVTDEAPCPKTMIAGNLCLSLISICSLVKTLSRLSQRSTKDVLRDIKEMLDDIENGRNGG